MKIIFAYFTLILFSLTSVNAREKFIHKIKPDLLKVQFAGNIGVLATGIEYSFLVDKIHFGILYGFAPSSIVGRDIHTISIKNSMGLFRQPLFNKALLGITTGFSFNY